MFLLRVDCWTRGKLSNKIDWQFSRLSRFSTNGISLRSGEAEMKYLQRSGQVHFIRDSSPDSAPPNRFATWYSLFAALCPQMWAGSQARTIVMQNVKPTNYTLTEKLIFFIQKRKTYILFHAHKENSVYFVNRKIIFLIYSLSVFDIPKLCYNLHNSNTEICKANSYTVLRTIHPWMWGWKTSAFFPQTFTWKGKIQPRAERIR